MKRKNLILFTLSSCLYISNNLYAQEAKTTDYQYKYLQKDAKPKPLGQQINNAYNTGLLTEKEKQEIDKELKRLQRQREKAMADGKLSAEEKAKLAKLRKEIREDLKEKRNSNRVDSAKMIESLEKRIQAGIADGSITPAEAKRLNEMLARAKGFNQRKVASDNNRENRTKLAEMLKETNKTFFQERRNTEVTCKNLSEADCKELKELSKKYNEE